METIATITGGADSSPQRSEGWHAIRAKSFGGSESAKLFSDAGIAELIRKKLGFGEQFTGNMATRWGTVFEPMCSELARILHGIPAVYECGSVPGPIAAQRYSPDGFGLVGATRAELARIEKMTAVGSDGDSEEKKTDSAATTAVATAIPILFEFKCPWSRVPKRSCVPPAYIKQIQTGLACMDEIHYASFLDAVFRVCTESQLKAQDLSFCDHIHNGRGVVPEAESGKFVKKGAPGMSGVLQIKIAEKFDVAVAMAKKRSEREFAHESLHDMTYTLAQLWREHGLNSDTFDLVLQRVCSGDYKIKYISDNSNLVPIYGESPEQTLISDVETSERVVKKPLSKILQLIERDRGAFTDSTNCRIAYIPFKLLNYEQVRVSREAGYKAAMIARVTAAAARLEEVSKYFAQHGADATERKFFAAKMGEKVPVLEDDSDLEDEDSDSDDSDSE